MHGSTAESGYGEKPLIVSFAEMEADFLASTREIVWCTVTTVDGRGRPRSRIMHPIFTVGQGRPVGWVLTAATPIKTAHLAANDHVAVSSWSPAQHTMIADCRASWVEEPAAKRQVWDLFATTPAPLGYDPGGGGVLSGPEDSAFTPLRFDPWRIQVLRFPGWGGDLTPRVWVDAAAPSA